jgi:hypothetical protein
MPAEIQSAPALVVKAEFAAAQEVPGAPLPPEESAADRAGKWARFNELCEEASRQAEANGLTEEILTEILAEE